MTSLDKLVLAPESLVLSKLLDIWGLQDLAPDISRPRWAFPLLVSNLLMPSVPRAKSAPRAAPGSRPSSSRATKVTFCKSDIVLRPLTPKSRFLACKGGGRGWTV